jgi:hypothetical protein
VLANAAGEVAAAIHHREAQTAPWSSVPFGGDLISSGSGRACTARPPARRCTRPDRASAW